MDAVDDFEARRRKAKELAMEKAERDRLNAVKEIKVTFPALDESCCICGSTVRGLMANRHSKLAALICHPWGPLGGSMHDQTVKSLTKLLGHGAGITTLRFNFRSGIGRGHSSAADIQGACHFLVHALNEVEHVLLVGYSYGSSIVASVAAEIPLVSAFILVAPPLDYNRTMFMGRSPITPSLLACNKPKLLLLGDSDQFCSQVILATHARALPYVVWLAICNRAWVFIGKLPRAL